jgi:hypothetical protein
VKQNFYYFTNGLQIDSEIELPELSVGQGDKKISVTLGVIDKLLEENIYKDKFQQISKKAYQLDVEGIAIYKFTFPDRVEVQTYPNANMYEVRLYLIASIIPVAVLINDFIPIHSCCIHVKGNAFLVGGESGAGKSTLALGMYNKGYEVLNDDVSTVSFNSIGKPIAYTGFKHIKLWEESLNQYNLKASSYEKIKDDMSKYRFPIQQSISKQHIPIKAIYLFKHDDENKEVSFKQLKGIQAVTELTKNTFRVELLNMLQRKISHFEKCVKLANQLNIIQVSRPSAMKAKDFADIMEQEFLKSSVNKQYE